MYGGISVNPNAQHKVSVFEMVKSVVKNHDLILQMTQREVIGRYRGSILGIAWSFFNPLIMARTFLVSINSSPIFDR